MSDLEPDAKSIVDAARDADDPTAQDRARVHRAVMAAIAGGATVIAAGSAAAGTGASATTGASASVAPAAVAAVAGTGAVAAGGMSIAAKIVAVVLIAGALGGGALLVTQPWDAEPEPEAVTATETEAEAEAETEAEAEAEAVTETVTETVAVPAPEAAATPEAPEATPEEVAARAAEARRQIAIPRAGTRISTQPGAAGALGATPLQIEARLIREATEALARGDEEAANRALDEHARRFPSGLLLEERERLRTRRAGP